MLMYYMNKLSFCNIVVGICTYYSSSSLLGSCPTTREKHVVDKMRVQFIERKSLEKGALEG